MDVARPKVPWHQQRFNSKAQKYGIDAGAPSGDQTVDVVNPDTRAKRLQKTSSKSAFLPLARPLRMRRQSFGTRVMMEN
jgi:hypothetical protein